jgi:hypothetical protein
MAAVDRLPGLKGACQGHLRVPPTLHQALDRPDRVWDFG